MKPQLLKLCLILSLFPLIFSLVSCQNQQPQDRGITITTNQSQSQQKQRRTALVIGNASYQDNPLKNSINDAEAMANALKDVGFDVILLENADLKQIENAIDTFHHQLKAGGVGLFYYAGHGIQVDGENYLIPVNAKLDVAEDVRYEAIPVGKVLARMEDAANQMNIVILDACRNNPFARKWRSSQRGLAPIQSARGALIAFATEPGGVAADGEGENGLYTSFLLKHLKTPNLDVELMFKRVREDLVQATQNKQVPWEYSSLVGDFSFNPVTVAQSSQPNSTTAETYFKQGEDYRNNNQYDKAKAKPTSSPVLSQPRTTLISRSTGVNYTNLRDLLAAGKWREADEETTRRMLQAAKSENKGFYDREDIQNFSCEDLGIIDQLWLSASNGKFGFSVQQEIYESLGGTRYYNEEVWKKFGDRVGWRKGGDWVRYQDLTFNNAEAPKAHLPFGRSGGVGGSNSHFETILRCFSDLEIR
ncbi:MAG: peptidase C14 [Microcystis aeruginosa LL13-06]|nr:peptidase C14 [Microcystis aeruginosa LL13-06]